VAQPTITSLIRDGVLDPELAALAWILIGGGVEAHVVAPTPADAEPLAAGLRSLASDSVNVTVSAGDALERVLALPVPLRPATGTVLVVRDGAVAAAHLLRPPLRDAGGHVRSQNPAVLAVATEDGAWEHFAWGIGPELSDLVGSPAGDFEIDLAARRDYLAAMVEADVVEPEAVATAVARYAFGAGRTGADTAGENT
jgi:hypothetical protein